MKAHTMEKFLWLCFNFVRYCTKILKINSKITAKLQIKYHVCCVMLNPKCSIFLCSLLYCLGADPKSVVCAFFKQGQCSKGDKCKFSHDLSLDRKGEKRSLYVDQRDAEEELKNGIYFQYLSVHAEIYKPFNRTIILSEQ